MIQRVIFFLILAQAIFSLQLVIAQADVGITLHQYVNPSCELVQSATLRDRGQYASISIPGIQEEIYSPELSRDDLLVFSPDAPGEIVKLARRSGFKVESDPNTEITSPRVVVKGGNGECPSAQEATQTVSQELRQRRQLIQSKVYRPGSDGVVPPVTVPPQVRDLGAATSGTAMAPTTHRNSEPKVQADVILEFVVGTDGSVSHVKVVRSASKELDKKAVEVAETWRFVPARKSGMPVTVLINAKLDFKLY